MTERASQVANTKLSTMLIIAIVFAIFGVGMLIFSFSNGGMDTPESALSLTVALLAFSVSIGLLMTWLTVGAIVDAINGLRK